MTIGIVPYRELNVADPTWTSTLTEPGDRKVSGPYRDGNAAYLPVRTMLRAVSGYERSCRIGALVDDRVRVYLAQQEDGPVSTPRRCALTPSPDAPVVTRCDALPPVPQRVEVNTLLDAENKVLEYTYGNDNTTFTINYGADPTCRQRADVRLLLDHALEAAGSTQ